MKKYLLPFFQILSTGMLLSSCASYKPLMEPSSVSSLRPGDVVQLKRVYGGDRTEEIKEMKITEVRGDSLLLGTVDMGPDFRNVRRQIMVREVTELKRQARVAATPHEMKQPEEVRKNVPLDIYSKSIVYVGYNTFNEVYAGLQFPKASAGKMAVEAGYQFTLAQDHAGYNTVNMTLTNKAEGLRARIGYVYPKPRGRGYKSVYFEYQDLQSVIFDYRESAHSNSYEATFKESYRKYGVKLFRIIPLGEGIPVYFIYSAGLFYMDVTRNYLTDGFAVISPQKPTDKVEYFKRPSFQLSIGLRFYIY